MRVLVLGGGGREHALCWALARDPQVAGVLCAPGNAGIAAVAGLRAVDPVDPPAVVALVREERPDLVVVGPEAPLVAGVADALHEHLGVVAFGPTAAGARVESSKSFAKQLMVSAGVPTAGYWAGSDPARARAALDGFAPPYVVKADGLAAGKGVRICADRGEAEAAIDDALVHGMFGSAGAAVVVEEYLHGPEVSVFALCDGTHALRPFATAQDYKRALDGDAGPNTGGMGAYSPVPAWTPALEDFVAERVFTPVLRGLSERGARYVGVLYAGLVLTADGPKVLEFNARFGDPEAQVVLPRVEGLAEALGSVTAGAADRGAAAGGARDAGGAGGAGGATAGAGAAGWRIRSQAAVTVVLASGGYPGGYEIGRPIAGLEAAAAVPGAVVFHAGTRRDGDRVVTAGGRVLAVTGLGDTIAEARATAYAAADCVSFDGLHRRNDIAADPST